MTFKYWIKRVNERIALFGTNAFGTMWAFYIFFAWGLLGMMPFLPAKFTAIVLLVSSAWIQLWALPLLAVGNAVLNKSSEKRAKEDHQSLKSTLAELKDMQRDNDKMKEQLDKIEFMLSAVVKSLAEQKRAPHHRSTDKEI